MWTKEEDEQLLHCMKFHGDKFRRYISKTMMKSMIKCHKRFLELNDMSDVLTTRWIEQEDQILRDYVMT